MLTTGKVGEEWEVVVGAAASSWRRRVEMVAWRLKEESTKLAEEEFP